MTKLSQDGFFNDMYRGVQYQKVKYSLETPEGEPVEYCGAFIYHGSKNEISQGLLYFQKLYSEEFHGLIKEIGKKEKKNVKKKVKKKEKRK